MQEVIHIILIIPRASSLNGSLIQNITMMFRTADVDLVYHSVPDLNFPAIKTLIYTTLSNDSSERCGALFDALHGSSSDLESHSINLVDESVFAFGMESFTAKLCRVSSQRCLQAGYMGSGESCRAGRAVGMSYRFRVGEEHMQTQQSRRGEQAGYSHIEISHLAEEPFRCNKMRLENNLERMCLELGIG